MTADERGGDIGNVAQEAARLVDAFASWSGHDATQAEAGDPGEAPAVCPECGSVPPDGRAGEARSEERVGSTSEELPPTCRICPVCQGLALLRSVRPETVDRLADLVGVLADSLRALADTRREADGSRPRPRPEAQDIPVTEDDPDEETDQEGRI